MVVVVWRHTIIHFLRWVVVEMVVSITNPSLILQRGQKCLPRLGYIALCACVRDGEMTVQIALEISREREQTFFHHES